jgi:hypothetical protein
VKPRFWLWPNLLSLDAPVVAVLWQILFLRCLGAPVRILPCALLFLTVWLIYVADRLLDTRRAASSQPRHAFYRRHFGRVFAVWICALAVTGGLVLSPAAAPYLARGSLMLGAVFVYLLAVQALRFGVKEGAVAVLFALGTSLPAWGRIRTSSDAMTVVLFSALCWLNCVAIEQWESGPRLLPVGLLAGIVGVTGWIALRHDRPILAGAEVASLFALVVLDWGAPRLSRDALRVLADVALLSPVLFLPIVH